MGKKIEKPEGMQVYLVSYEDLDSVEEESETYFISNFDGLKGFNDVNQKIQHCDIRKCKIVSVRHVGHTCTPFEDNKQTVAALIASVSFDK